MIVNRREFVGLATGITAFGSQATQSPDASAIEIVDSHIHLFDPNRPQGVPWPPKDDRILYKPALPARYLKVTAGLGVVGAIVIEASPLPEDNQWVLNVAARNPVILGYVGDLEPGGPDFRAQLEKLHKNPLFRGLRYGTLWGRDLSARVNERQFLSDLKVLASTDLELDTANPTPPLIAAIVKLTDEVPTLRVVIDHLPHLQVPRDPAAQKKYEEDLRELGKRPQVYVKVSEVLRKMSGHVLLDPGTYRPTLDHLWEIFGEDRLIYGSDWPNSDPWGTYEQVLSIVRPYFVAKGRTAAEKFFLKNSQVAYKWEKRA
jgi:L-fuconolactonase